VQLTGGQFDENQLAAEAEANGWYEPGVGTAMADMGKLLEAHGVHTETHENGTLDDVAAQLEAGNKVLVSVDESVIREIGKSSVAHTALDVAAPGMGPAQSVQLVGIAETTDGQSVVLNDSSSPDGRGAMVPAAGFITAWSLSARFYVAAGPTTRGRGAIRHPSGAAMNAETTISKTGESRTATLLHSIRRTPLFRQLIPQEAGISWPWPLPSRRNGRAFATLPFFGLSHRRDESAGWDLHPPFATMTFDWANGKAIPLRASSVRCFVFHTDYRSNYGV
jgi:hypothetical protein